MVSLSIRPVLNHWMCRRASHGDVPTRPADVRTRTMFFARVLLCASIGGGLLLASLGGRLSAADPQPQDIYGSAASATYPAANPQWSPQPSAPQTLAAQPPVMQTAAPQGYPNAAMTGAPPIYSSAPSMPAAASYAPPSDGAMQPYAPTMPGSPSNYSPPMVDNAVAPVNYNMPANPPAAPPNYGAGLLPSSRATAPAAQPGMPPYGADPTATAAPQQAYLTSFQQDGAALGGPLPAGDVLGRLEAAEAELNALRQQMEPNNRRLHELEEAHRKAVALEKPLPLVRLSGFFQYDTGWFSQDIASKEALGNIQNGTGFRRTRLQGLGQLTEFTTFSIEMDFAFPGRPSFMDVWGEQANLPFVGHARIGQYRQPVTMDSWTNIKHLEFLERSAPFIAMDPFRRVGIMGWDNSDDQNTMFAASLFSTGWTFWNTAPASTYNTEGNDDRFGTQIGDSGGVAFASRMTHLLYYDPHANNRYLLHAGGGYMFGELGGQGNVGSFAKAFQARSIPEFFVGDQGGGFLTAAGTPNVVDTGRFLATHYQLMHAELAGSYGPAHFQAEYMAQFVNQRGGGNVFFNGGYIQGGYFLTGENTGYNKLMGAMDYNVKPHSEFFGTGRKKPLCGWGAWELAARWSWLDLSNVARVENYLPTVIGPPNAPNPGILNEPTIALNWWWNQYMRVQFNYIHSMVNSNLNGFYATDIYALRFQTEF